jgi:hypothetical protein
VADRGGQRIVLVAVVLTSFMAFRLSPNRLLSDSFYSTLLSYSVLTTGSVHLERFLGDATTMQGLPGFVPERGHPYQIERAGDHLLYWYPPLPSLLAVPLVAGAAVFDLTPIGSDGHYDPRRDDALHAWLGPLVGAAVVGVLFAIATELLTLPAACATTALAALGSPIWSTLSRTMSSNTWHALLLSLVVLELLRSARTERPVRAVLVATLLAWAYMSRPATSIAIAAVTVWMLLRHPQRFAVYAATGAAWAGVFFVYSFAQFGVFLPSYYRLAATMSLTWLLPSMEGLLFSPGRGLFVYSPVVLWVGWLAVRYRRTIRFPDLALLAVTIVGVTFVVMSTWRVWWGGHSYGPRLCADFIPWIFLVAVLALDARRRALASDDGTAGAPRVRSRRRLELAFGIVLGVASATLHAPGALQFDALLWNERLGPEHGEPPLLWDWQHPQFLAAYRMPPPFNARRPPTD